MNIGDFEIGKGRTFVIAELGINHNGSLAIAKQLIDAAKKAGCDGVKFQKRSLETVYTTEELAQPRETPFGSTNGDLKRGLEFSFESYVEIDRYCGQRDILWFASPWDEASVAFLEQFPVPCHKIAAAGLTDAGLLRSVRATGKPVLLSTGMSREDEIDGAVQRLSPSRLLLMHCVSLYPAPPETVNLRALRTLAEKYDVPVGYSGHELDAVISAAAVALGACAIERHLTLDRSMWGSDQKASITPDEMEALVQNIRTVERALGSPELRCLPEEIPVRNKLRRVHSL
jgi:N-acetylneuraminate synthase